MKPSVLIIDDNKDFLGDLSLLLQKDYYCQGALSAEKGLDLLQKKNFDLILLDIDLGSGMDGFDVLAKIKELEISVVSVISCYSFIVVVIILFLL